VNKASKLISGLGLSCASLFLAVGCEPPAETGPKFLPNKVYALRWEVESEVDLTSTLKDIQVVLEDSFGTAAEPKVPKFFTDNEDFKEILNLDKLKRACGADPAVPRVEAVYVKNCINCHAWEGSGRGPGSAGVDPYPRDFRAGVFKYKSTQRLAKPLKSDLIKTVKYGLAGSGMGAYDKLTDTELDDVIEYVVYLALRGEFERKLLDYSATEMDLTVDDKGNVADRWVVAEGDVLKVNSAQQEIIDEILEGIATSWVESKDQLVEVTRPTDIPVLEKTPASWDEVTANPELLASVTKGKEIFLGQAAVCSSCHGPGGLGDGRTTDYDDWTKEWTARINVDPTDQDAIIPFLLRGALPPKTIKPRNLRVDAFRGGRTPENLFIRLRHGIANAPMPAITPVASPEEPGVMEKDLWHVINYVLAMPVEPKPWPTAPVAPPAEATPAVQDAAAE
jgi:mono/diheme cytochrome c family protein